MTQSEHVEAARPAYERPLDAPGYRHTSAISPGRAAWIVLLGAFGMFCLLGLSAGYGIYTYLFRSTVPLPAVLQVAQGTVGITGADLVETVEREREDLTNSQTSVSTDSLSQATIQFHDIESSDAASRSLLAAVTLRKSTSVTFEHARRPRFSWSLNQFSIRLSGLNGALDLLVTGAAAPFNLSLGAYGGVEIDIAQQGRYRIAATDDEVRMWTLAGLRDGALRR